MTKEINQNGGAKPYRPNRPQCFSNVTDRIPARLVLYFLSWSGFLVSFMMRNDINFALVAMVRSPTTSTILNGNHTTETIKQEELGEFDWSSTVTSVILGSFYWCYVLSQVVGGVATQYFGTKNVFGWSQFATALCSLCIPFASSFHYGALIALRLVQGFASGLTWPAMYAIVVYWIPPIERSRFMSSFQGFSIGIGLTYPLCGFIISHWGWRAVFYTTGTIGMTWCVMWYFLAFDTPSLHPRITASELEYIELNIDKEIKDGRGMTVPWKEIFKSLPAWAIGITTFGRIWVHYTFIMYGPMYMKDILKFSIQENGLLSGTPFLCSYISSVLFCWIADYLMTKELMTLTNIRKMFTAMSQVVPGVLCLFIGFFDFNTVPVLVIWFLAVTLITASYAGAMASIVDIAPNLAGPVLAFCQTIHMTASFLSPVVAGFILTDKTALDQWQTVFGSTAVIAISTYIIFQIYGTAEIQHWNYPKTKTTDEEASKMLPAVSTPTGTTGTPDTED
ncbi:sialin isoform X2 [Bradysia coprophila]|nr:sialin isoform X2 [Bradysia coprophila]XP_037043316.1 sialin isoform X2 [Bradysia coprophila]XP_037043317.1 sialin isoform X2 [Bradysia coprophila]XP_037043318.1 sialin isoform X2 [Bradysia coprophila]XP_037043319.1 sialin isoform X2 [Bradysia coprophila]